MLLRNPYFAPFWHSHWRTAVAAAAAGLVNSLLTLLLPLSLGRFYEQLLGGTSNRSHLLALLELGGGAGRGWTAFFVTFAALILAKGLAEWAEYRLMGTLGETFGRYVRERVFAHQLAVPAAVHRQKAPGKYLLRYGSDFGSLRRYATQGLVGFGKDVLFLTLALLLLLWLHPGLTLLMAASALPFVGLFRWVNGAVQARTARRRDLRSAYLNHVTTRLAAFETIKVFNRETVENEQFAKRSATLSRANADVLGGRAILAALLPLTTYAMIFAVLIGIHAGLGGVGRVGGGVVVAFVLLVLSLRPVLRRLLRVGTVWRSGRISLEKLQALLAQPAEGTGAPTALLVTRGGVVFDRVSFAHQPGRPVLSDLSFSVEGGTLVHLRGESGAGKTTALNLLLGLYAPDAGQVQIDGQNLAECAPASVRRQVTLASADVPLLGRTVFEAVAYRRGTERRARAESLLADLQTRAELCQPLSLDDPIGEGGSRLSTGQRSVLRLVRALLTRKPILLLDEPFEGIGDAGVARLLDWLSEQTPRRTVLLCSSRPLPVPLPVVALQGDFISEMVC